MGRPCVNMIGICIESSHRGMGHLFRAITIYDYFAEIGEKAIIIVNNDKKSNVELKRRNIVFATVEDADNYKAVGDILLRYKVELVIIDKFKSSYEYVEYLNQKNLYIVGIDDYGNGAELFDLHFCPLLFGVNKIGKKVCDDKKYIILNPEINIYRRKRNRINSILVTMGGTDTYGVTIKLMPVLDGIKIKSDILIGPGFVNEEELINKNNKPTVIKNVPSLIELFHQYDLLICGGGITAIEANASGLPCIIIANELHEILIGKWLENIGGACFLGYFKNIIEDDLILKINDINISELSNKALGAVDSDGVIRFYDKVINEWQECKDNN